MKILALDPGPEKTGYVAYEDGRVLYSGILLNNLILSRMQMGNTEAGLGAFHHCAIEMIASYGMAVGKSVFETCVWIGRYMQVWEEASSAPAIRITRIEVKTHLCHSAKAKDANIRQALIDRIGPVGTKKDPGPLYGVTSHAWAALAVAVTAADRLRA